MAGHQRPAPLPLPAGHLTLFGYVEQTTGDVELGIYNHATGGVTVRPLHSALGYDAHDSPSIMVRPDGYVVAAYSSHGGARPLVARTPHWIRTPPSPAVSPASRASAAPPTSPTARSSSWSASQVIRSTCSTAPTSAASGASPTAPPPMGERHGAARRSWSSSPARSTSRTGRWARISIHALTWRSPTPTAASPTPRACITCT